MFSCQNLLKCEDLPTYLSIYIPIIRKDLSRHNKKRTKWRTKWRTKRIQNTSYRFYHYRLAFSSMLSLAAKKEVAPWASIMALAIDY